MIYPGNHVALKNINCRIGSGEFVFIVGPSGAGKSTFIKLLFREIVPTTGTILLDGQNASWASSSRISGCCRTGPCTTISRLRCRSLSRRTG